MQYLIIIHWQLRKGLGPEWTDKVSEFFYDDLPFEATFEEARSMAISDFKSARYRNGMHDGEYIITDVCTD